MAVEFKDYYHILGVSKGANPDEIRKAFRRLARQFHPDVARNVPNGEMRFKEVNEAYDVLSDPTRRAKYNGLWAMWKEGNGDQSRPDPAVNAPGRDQYQSGPNFEFKFTGTGFSDFFDRVFGSNSGGQFHRGPGSADRESPSRGRDVESEMLISLQEAMVGSVRPITLQMTHSCEVCEGSGRFRDRACPACSGQGHVKRTVTRQVRVPPGVREGQRLRISGCGSPGACGAAAGDLYLRVRYERHPAYHIDGSHLYYELELDPGDADQGTTALIPSLEGPAKIRIPAGSQAGQMLRLRGRGLPGVNGNRGDLFVKLRLKNPENRARPQQTIWERLAARRRKAGV